MDGDGNPLPPLRRDHLKKSGMLFGDLLAESLAVNATLMAPKSCFERAGPYDESLRWGEGQDMILRLSVMFPFQSIDEKLYSYRVHEGNSTVTVPEKTRYYYKSVILHRHIREHWDLLDDRARRDARTRLLTYYSRSGQRRKLYAESLLLFAGRILKPGKGEPGKGLAKLTMNSGIRLRTPRAICF